MHKFITLHIKIKLSIEPQITNFDQDFRNKIEIKDSKYIINKEISNTTSPLNKFVREYLIIERDHSIKVSSKENNYNTLYGLYHLWAKDNEINTISLQCFTKKIMNILKTLNWNVTRKRINTGLIIIGINWNHKQVIFLKNKSSLQN